MAAIFLIVVLGALAAFAVQVALAQYQSASLELLEARAQAAANTGIEYAANRALLAGGCGAVPATLTPPALSGYVVSLSCVPNPGNGSTNKIDVPASTPYLVYALTSTATYGTYGKYGFVSRTATRIVTNAPL